jgi:hypothetical protein
MLNITDYPTLQIRIIPQHYMHDLLYLLKLHNFRKCLVEWVLAEAVEGDRGLY